MELVIDRWLHVLAGITWIGLLYYFNLVQAVALPKAKAPRRGSRSTSPRSPCSGSGGRRSRPGSRAPIILNVRASALAMPFS
jgi:hypothetical protein